MYAVIKTGGKQYRVEVGTTLDVELLDGEAGTEITFSDILLVGDDAGAKVGQPTVAGASVSAKIVDQVRGPKLIAFKKIKRQGKQLKKGHRQDLTRVTVTAVNG
jgi:large subunit ribosomal protein L21